MVLAAAPSKFSVGIAPAPAALKNNLFVVDALTIILAVPSKETLLMETAVAKADAVAALPVVLASLLGISAATNALY